MPNWSSSPSSSMSCPYSRLPVNRFPPYLSLLPVARRTQSCLRFIQDPSPCNAHCELGLYWPAKLFQGKPLDRVRILLADDNEEFLALATRILEPEFDVVKTV